MIGTVSGVFTRGGYAWVVGEDGIARFAHAKEFKSPDEFRALREGDAVDFEHVDGPRGPRAVKVTRRKAA